MSYWRDKGRTDGARGGVAVYESTTFEGIPYGSKTWTDVNEY